MAVQLIKSPIGHKLSPVLVEAQIIDDGTGVALVYTQSSHLLSDGDYVYIQSNFESYNGFKYVDSTAYDAFKIKESENGEYVQYVQDGDIQYQVSLQDHGFQCVHLPIVYELESDIWPNNTGEETYTPNTVVTQASASGYTQLNLIEALSDPTVYAKIELVGAGSLAGVYQILTVLQPWSVVIDLPYSASNSFSGYVVVKYYDNYAINVNVYAGLTADHRWESRKPFELAATLKFVPDENGQVKFSIAEILRAYIQNRNNLTLDTLPNNLDFIVGFYISYFESYDDSDGEEITTFEGEVTEDDFIGYALNSKLEFKSENIGHMSDYIDAGSEFAQWLTIFNSPIIMAGRFFDLSFLNQYNGFDVIVKKNGVTFLTIPEPGIGILRIPIEAESGDETLCIIAYISGDGEIGLSDFQNNDVPGAPNWTAGSQPQITSSTIQSDILYLDYPFVPGVSYTLTSVFTQSGSSTFSLLLGVYDSAFSLQHSGTNNTPVGTESVSVTFTAGIADVKIGFRKSVGIGSSTVVINSLTLEVTEQQVTEEICLTVLNECDSTFIGDARLLEDGNYRLLE